MFICYRQLLALCTALRIRHYKQFAYVTYFPIMCLLTLLQYRIAEVRYKQISIGKLAMWCFCHIFSVPVFRWKMWCWSLTNTSSCMSVVCQLRQCVFIRTRYQNLMFKATVPQESLISSSPCKLHHAWLRLTSHVCVDNEIIAICLVFLRDLQVMNYTSLWHEAY